MEPAPPRANLALTGLVLASFSGLVGLALLRTLMPYLSQQLHVSVVWLGQLDSAAGLVALLSPLVLGPLGEQRDRRILVLGGLGLAAMATLVIAGSGGLIAVAVGWVLFALADASLRLGGPALVIHTSRGAAQHRGLSWVMAGAGVGWAIVPGLVFLATIRGWRETWLWMLPLFLVAGTLIKVHVPAASSPITDLRTVVRSYARSLSTPAAAGLSVAVVARGMMTGGVSTYWAAFFARRYAFGLEDMGLTYAISSVGFFLGTMLARPVMARVGARGLYAAASATSAVSIATLFGGVLNPYAALACILFALGVESMASVAQTSLVAADNPLPTTALAGAALCSGLGKVLGASLGGGLLALGGFPVVGGGLALVTLTSLLVALSTRLRPAPATAP